MRFFNIFLIFAVVIAAVSATPHLTETDGDDMVIQPRVTCDIIGGEWGDRACAAHCIAKGYRGGWCDDRKVCNCR
ncbi:U-Asilidin(12)-Dg3b-like [Condylostylus longicornis]|uniref:U-Asilidin(12)-Dg3b-like n=1 Tax=Condylostylus longicornis TaxID=2530218 RepID=UPI00244D9DF7|nr:U-Asilidin(12)-Dg3b-like [Condylostylus longicornis]